MPKEVIDYDNQLPLLAEPGMDRRRQSFGSLRQATQQARENESSDVSPAQTDHSKLFDLPLWSSDAVPLEEIWNSEMASEAEHHAIAPLAAAPASSPASPANSSDQRPAEAPKTAESPKIAESPKTAEPPAEDLGRYLDFTPTRQDETAALSGPSFLGLSDDAEPVERQPELRTRRWPRYLASGFIAAIAALMLMHGTSLRDTASRYARVGASYASLLRTGKTDSPTEKPGPPNASAGPASSKPSTPDFVVQQRPANPAQAASGKPPASEAHAAPEAQPAPPANPATAGSGDSPRAAQAGKTTQTSNSQPHTPAAEHKQLAETKPSAATPAWQSRPPQVAGQGEYQQALAATNPEIARALLWRATALGNADAQVRLADMYIYGEGVPENCDQGLVLLRSAAQKANSRARGKLGALYATGKCVSQNRVEAYRWLSLALNGNQGSEWTEKNREMVWRQMSPDERSRVTTAISTR